MSGSTANIVSQPIKNALIPSEGPKTVPITCKFSVYASLSLSLQNIQARNFISIVQTVFVDNSNNMAPVYITTGVANQTVVCPPQSQGYFPILCPLPPAFVFTSSGGVDVAMQLINVPMPCAVWSASANVPGSTAIDTTVISGRASVTDGALISNGSAAAKLINSAVYTIQLTSSVGSGTLITGNTNWFMNGLILTATSDFATPANQVLTLSDSGSGLAVINLPPPPAGQTANLDLGQMLSRTITGGSNLTLATSQSITAGSLYVIVRGGTTTQYTT